MRKKAVLVSVHSRKGGVGKTSIVMSTAIQLAAQGKKIAVLDLDTLGAHLSQSLPLKDDLKEAGEVLEFNVEESPNGERYSDKPYIAWRFTGHPKGPKLPIPLLAVVKQHLAVEQSVREMASASNVLDRLSAVEENLCLFPMSPYIRDVDRLNKLTLSKDGQEKYLKVLAELVAELDDNGYEYIIMDNSPGLSFNPGLTLHMALKEGLSQQKKESRQVHNWFVGNAPWWEQGLTVYEMSTYRDHLKNLNAVLVVNRVGRKWLDDDDLQAGTCWPIEKNTNLYKKLVDQLFCIPMWLSADVDPDRIANRFMLPSRFYISILGDDDTIRRAQMTEADYHSVEATGNGRSGHQELTENRYRNFVILAQRYLQFFVLPALKAVQKGLAEGAESAEKSEAFNETSGPQYTALLPISPFHDHVYSALVKPLVAPVGYGDSQSVRTE